MVIAGLGGLMLMGLQYVKKEKELGEKLTCACVDTTCSNTCMLCCPVAHGGLIAKRE